jgi:hypothetical protein
MRLVVASLRETQVRAASLLTAVVIYLIHPLLGAAASMVDCGLILGNRSNGAGSA